MQAIDPNLITGEAIIGCEGAVLATRISVKVQVPRFYFPRALLSPLEMVVVRQKQPVVEVCCTTGRHYANIPVNYTAPGRTSRCSGTELETRGDPEHEPVVGSVTGEASPPAPFWCRVAINPWQYPDFPRASRYSWSSFPLGRLHSMITSLVVLRTANLHLHRLFLCQTDP